MNIGSVIIGNDNHYGIFITSEQLGINLNNPQNSIHDTKDFIGEWFVSFVEDEEGTKVEPFLDKDTESLFSDNISLNEDLTFIETNTLKSNNNSLNGTWLYRSDNNSVVLNYNNGNKLNFSLYYDEYNEPHLKVKEGKYYLYYRKNSNNIINE